MPKAAVTRKKQNIPANDVMSRHEVNVYIGGRIRAIRVAKDLKQKDIILEMPSKITQQQYSKYETGYNAISASLLFEIATVLGVTVDTLMPLSVSRMKETATKKRVLRSVLENALASFDNCSKVSKEELKALEKSLMGLCKF